MTAPMELVATPTTTTISTSTSSPPQPSSSSAYAKISFFDRYLFVWVALCMVVGSLIGYFLPSVAKALDRAQVFGISVPMAILLWIMIFPMLLSVDWVALKEVAKVPGPVVLTSVTNFLVQPFLAYGVSVLFFRVLYSKILSKGDADQYIAGSVLLAAAPCTAMVLVWSLLVGGNAAYTIIQVAVNDLLTLALFVPIVSLLLGKGVTAGDVPPPYKVVTASVLAFVGLPLLVAVFVRLVLVRRLGGRAQAQRAIEKVAGAFKPVTLAGLLATLVLVFVFQGALIGSKALHILLIAVPMTLSTAMVWALVYLLGSGLLSMPHELLAPAALIATSNFFELAIAVAVGAFGAASGAALAASVGVLVEVPVMLALVAASNALRGRADARARAADWGRLSWARRLFAPPGMVGVGAAAAGAAEEEEMTAAAGEAAAGKASNGEAVV